ncbi:MBL fold metallo-hydrolase [Candidatus Endoriftia persephonae]|uniref:MBL fold metallo-hydrolase n=3 Tax=Gammaproteobacteria TaxID=1236 RepID=A0A9J6ZZR4_9GAMM|nr:MBL fold metallo-hydrolase [Candidatus Endoriftia persephone]EGV50141.1 putative metallo-hydrolase [endosymbiont of Riftia pachyptila (vent Ph05)]KRT53668.1 Phosphoribosyl 1,2-cyclic phosphodiesterase [endosymbiont of Ridgeia piscesae]KRT57039.1 Phosphoribosyl 1,2-cyclic phosphodiesterase [endosymbiont of Ridgeia piscesae]USF88379.1 MBL fold metallo-hydrolase [Candidatus Endoriftia persephone]
MRFASLGSGSRGNALLVDSGGVRVLLDCGFPATEVERRLQRLGVEAGSIDAIIVTHEHGDHLRGVGPLARRHEIPVWMTEGTRSLAQARCGELPEVHAIDSHCSRFCIGDLSIEPFPIPHDAREPCQFVFQKGGLRLGVVTDAGCITPHIEERIAACDALVLEFNHDTEMLANGPYPASLQARVGGNLGHLNNEQSAALLRKLDCGRIRHLLLAHLSEKNNTPEQVTAAVARSAETLLERAVVARQSEVAGWFDLEG